jgi:glycosyltransferase involved in cell wall biosynthesis
MRDRPNVHFAVVGAPVFRDADYLDELRSYAASEGLSERVHFVGWLDDARIAYAASDVNVNCSDDEPFGRTIIESAACGLPSIAFASGGTGEAMIDGETGRLIPPGDEAAFASAIAAYVDDPALAQSTSVAARRFAKTFNAPIHAERVAAVLRRAAERS